jgi:hypothetical protein
MAATNRHIGLPRNAAITSVMDSSDQVTLQLTLLTILTIVDAPLTLIFRMGQGA